MNLWTRLLCAAMLNQRHAVERRGSVTQMGPASSAVPIESTPWSRYSDGSLDLGPALTNRSLRTAINSALMSMFCAESRPLEEINLRLGFGWGNQLGIIIGRVTEAVVENGHRVNTTSVILGESGIVLPGHTPHGLMINNASRCDSDNLACMFMDVNEQCTLHRRDDAASNSGHHRCHAAKLVSSLVDSKLRHVPRYLVHGEMFRIVARPNARLRAHVHRVSQSAGRPHVCIHVRRGDRLTVTNGHDFIRAYPTSVLAALVRNATGAVPALLSSSSTTTTRPRVLVLSDDADVPDDLAYLLPEMDVHTLQHGDTLGEPLGKPALEMVKSWRLHGRERDGGSRNASHTAACGLPAEHGRPALPRCRPADAPDSAPRAHVHTFGADEMGPADFLFASASAMARACVMLLSVRSGYSMQMWNLAAAQHACEGTPHVVDLDGELTVSRLAAGYWPCGNRMLCPGPDTPGARPVHVCKTAAERCNRPFPLIV